MRATFSEPNLFEYATKELSQDAMICWLLKWSVHHEDIELNRLGNRFTRALFDKHDKRLDESIDKIEIYQQEKSIDVLARINARHVLLIEDTTVSTHHSNQLARYWEHVRVGRTNLGEVRASDLYPIYLKTGNHTYAEKHYVANDKELNYEVFDRGDFLNVLRTYQGQNPIVIHFREYLEALEHLTQAYTKWRFGHDIDKKNWEAWKGFYRALEEKLWDHSSPAKMWMGRSWPGWGSWDTARDYLVFWWRPSQLPTNQRVYLQLYQDELYFMLTGASCKKIDIAWKEWADDLGIECSSCSTTSDLRQCRRNLLAEWDKERFSRVDLPVKILESKRGGNSLKVAKYCRSYIKYDDAGLLDLDATADGLEELGRKLIEVVRHSETSS